MIVHELIRFLESCDRDAEVKLAHQPAYPLEYDVGQVVETSPGDFNIVHYAEGELEPHGWALVNEHHDPQEEEYYVKMGLASSEEAEAEMYRLQENFTPVVYLVEGNEQGYLGRDGAKAVGW